MPFRVYHCMNAKPTNPLHQIVVVLGTYWPPSRDLRAWFFHCDLFAPEPLLANTLVVGGFLGWRYCWGFFSLLLTSMPYSIMSCWNWFYLDLEYSNKSSQLMTDSVMLYRWCVVWWMGSIVHRCVQRPGGFLPRGMAVARGTCRTRTSYVVSIAVARSGRSTMPIGIQASTTLSFVDCFRCVFFKVFAHSCISIHSAWQFRRLWLCPEFFGRMERKLALGTLVCFVQMRMYDLH